MPGLFIVTLRRIYRWQPDNQSSRPVGKFAAQAGGLAGGVQLHCESRRFRSVLTAAWES